MNFSQIFPPDKDNEFSNRENKRNLPITTSIYIHYPYWNERENFLSTSMISQLKKKNPWKYQSCLSILYTGMLP